MALLCVVVFSVVRGMGRDFEIPMKLTSAVVFLGIIVSLSRPLMLYLRKMLAEGAVSEYAEILMGALGVAMLTGICADLCRECRETGIASYVEMAGRLEILLLCVPLIQDILAAVSGLLGAS